MTLLPRVIRAAIVRFVYCETGAVFCDDPDPEPQRVRTITFDEKNLSMRRAQ
jgi:hypothetical protein